MAGDFQRADKNREQSIEAIATFAALIHARRHSQFAAAAEALDTLRRLGIVVRFARPKAPRARREGGAA